MWWLRLGKLELFKANKFHEAICIKNLSHIVGSLTVPRAARPGSMFHNLPFFLSTPKPSLCCCYSSHVSYTDILIIGFQQTVQTAT